MDLNQDLSLYGSESGSLWGLDTSSEAPGSPDSDPLPAEDDVAFSDVSKFCLTEDREEPIMWSPPDNIAESSNKPVAEAAGIGSWAVDPMEEENLCSIEVKYILDLDDPGQYLPSPDGLHTPVELPSQLMEGDERTPLKSEEKEGIKENDGQSQGRLTLSGQIKSFKNNGNNNIITLQVKTKNIDPTIDLKSMLGKEVVLQLSPLPTLSSLPKGKGARATGRRLKKKTCEKAKSRQVSKCKKCNKSYAFKSGLSRHKMVEHSTRKFYCLKCKHEGFTRSDNLADHTARFH